MADTHCSITETKAHSKTRGSFSIISAGIDGIFMHELLSLQIDIDALNHRSSLIIYEDLTCDIVKGCMFNPSMGI
jgi:hypothetical protein